jgi:hypothetical protein
MGDLDGEIVFRGQRAERACHSARAILSTVAFLAVSLPTFATRPRVRPGEAASGVEHLPPRSCYQSPPGCNEHFRDPDLESSLGHRILVDPAILHNDQKVFVRIFD